MEQAQREKSLALGEDKFNREWKESQGAGQGSAHYTHSCSSHVLQEPENP